MARVRGDGGATDVEVVLVDDDVAPVAPVRADRSGGRSRRRASIGLAVLVAVVIGSGVVQAWQEQAELAALSSAPGFVPRLTTAPEVAWTLPSGQVRDSSDEILIVDDADGSGSSAVDVVTGQVLWRAPVASGWSDCRFLGRTRPWSFWGTGLHGGAAADEVLCAHRGILSGSEPTTLVQVLDARTGGVRVERTAPGESVLVDMIGDDVVLAWVGADRRPEVVRWDHEADVDRWRYRGERGRGAEDTGLGAWVAGDLLVLQHDAGTRVLSLEDGTVVPETETAGVVLPVAELADGATVELAGGMGLARSRVVVRDRQGAVRMEEEGWYAGPAVLDPRTPVLLVMDEEGGLSAHDVGDGTERWTRPVGTPATAPLPTWQPDTPLVLAGEVLVVTSDGQVEGIDARDGTSSWVAEGLESFAHAAVTDGRSVILPAHPRGGGATPGLLVALDLRDGSEVWRAALPEQGFAVGQAGETLLVQGAMGLIALRP